MHYLPERSSFMQKIREIVKNKPSIYESHYDDNQVIFIHIPKCAGSSVSHALYGKYTHHWKAEELLFINRKKFNSYCRFSVVRNPWDRLYSTYNYAFVDSAKFNNSPLQFITHYQTFEDFVLKGLTAELVQKVKFINTQWSFLEINGKLTVDFLGKFENIDNFIITLSKRLPTLTSTLPRMNVSPVKHSYRECYTGKMIDKVADLYRDDIENFSYAFN
jgi:hypothetical protein